MIKTINKRILKSVALGISLLFIAMMGMCIGVNTKNRKYYMAENITPPSGVNFVMGTTPLEATSADSVYLIADKYSYNAIALSNTYNYSSTTTTIDETETISSTTLLTSHLDSNQVATLNAVNHDDYVMLSNYNSKRAIYNATGTTTKAIENFYIGIGTYFHSGTSTTNYTMSSTDIRIESISIEGWLSNDYTHSTYNSLTSVYNSSKGVRIALNDPEYESNVYVSGALNPVNNYYWQQFFDLTNIRAITSFINNEPVTESIGNNTQGVYRFDFTVQYASSTGTTTQTTFSQWVSLLDDEKYIEYPSFNNFSDTTYTSAVEYKKSVGAEAYANYYYNYQTNVEPVMVYNTTLYQPTYIYSSTSYKIKLEYLSGSYYANTYVGNSSTPSTSIRMVLDTELNKVTYYNNSTEIGNLVINKTTGTYTLTINDNAKYSSGVVVKKGAVNTNIDYYYYLILNELGTYEFSFKYVLPVSTTSFAVLSDTAVSIMKNYKSNEASSAIGDLVLQYATYQTDGMITFNNISDITDTDMDTSKDGGYVLHNFGVVSTFYKGSSTNRTKTYFKQDNLGVYADVTEYLSSASTNISVGTSSISFTNTSPINVVSNDSSTNFYIPNTNLQPIYFDYYGNYNYKNNVSTSRVFRFDRTQYTRTQLANGYYSYSIVDNRPTTSVYEKDTTISLNGLYVVKIDYTYDFYNSPSELTQYFMFEINNTAPTLSFSTKDTTSGESTLLPSTTKYTNKAFLLASWADPNYFQGEISATIVRYAYNADGGFNAQGATLGYYTKESLMSVSNGATQVGKYIVTLHYGTNAASSRDYEVIIDRQAITSSIRLVDYNKDNESYITKTKDGNDTSIYSYNILNNYFTLLFNKKLSNAKITVKYKTIPFVSSASFSASKLDGVEAITTNATINGTNTLVNSYSGYILPVAESYSATQLDYANTTIARNAVFGLNGSAIYIFELEDEAQNTATVYYIYDTSVANALCYNKLNEVLTSSQMPSRIVTDDTRVYWGNYKAIAVSEGAISATFDSIFTAIGNNSSLYKNCVIQTIGGTRYLLVPISQAQVKVGTTYHKTSETNNSFTAYKYSTSVPSTITGWTNVGDLISLSQFFSGEKTYSYVLTDTLGNTTPNSSNYLIWMNFDKSQVIPLLKYSENYYSQIGVTATQPKAVSADSIYLSYKSAITTDGGDSFSTKLYYTFYPYDFDSYLNSSVTSYPTATGLNENEPSPTYPFSVTPTKDEQLLSNLSDSLTDTNAQVTSSSLKYTEGLNIIGTKSQAGMYVIKRVYVNGTDDIVSSMGENEDDTPIRYYVIYIDRNSVINLLYTSTGEIDNTLSIGDDLGMVLGYGTGDYVNNIEADDLMVLLTTIGGAQTTSTDNILGKNNIFNSNKLPIKINTILDKFSSANKLNNFTTSEIITNAIKANNSTFGLHWTLTFKGGDGDSVSKNIIDDNTIKDTSIGTLANLLLTNKGTYTLVITDSTGHDLIDNSGAVIPDSKAKSLQYSFNITTSRPEGDYYSLYTSGEDVETNRQLLNIKSPYNNGVTTFVSTNNSSLIFGYSDSTDDTLATIDPTYIKVEKSTNKTSYNTIFELNNNIVTATTSSLTKADVIKSTNIGETDDGLQLYSYALTLYNDFENTTHLTSSSDDAMYKVTIHFVGNENYYPNGDGTYYYSNTFLIYVDNINPKNNLNTLLSNDKLYSASTNLSTHFINVNNSTDNPTILDGTDAFDSYEIYFRNIDSDTIKDYLPSAVNGEIGTDGRLTFNKYDTTNYTRIIRYDDAHTSFSFSGFTNGYYEIIELDEAGNATNYGIYVGSDTTLNMSATTQVYDHVDEGGNITYTNDVITLTKGELSDITAFELTSINYAYGDGNNGYIPDMYTQVQLLNGTTVLSTLTSNPFNSTTSTNISSTYLNSFYSQVITAFNTIKNNNPNIYKYQFIITNRFGDNYVFNLNLPADELKLSIISGTASATVSIPAQKNGVYISSFVVQTWSSSIWVDVAQDVDKTIVKNPAASDNIVTYTFTSGQYKVETIDNFGRQQTYYFYVGSQADSAYTISYDKPTITRDNVIHTSGQINLTISVQLWIVTITDSSFTPLGIVGTLNPLTKMSTFALSTNGTYIVTLKWATAIDNSSNVVYTFVINSTKPTIMLQSENGGELSYTEAGTNAYTNDFYINWRANTDYIVTGVLTYTDTNNVVTTTNLTSSSLPYQITLAGVYKLVLTNAVGATSTYTFQRTDKSYGMYSVEINGVALEESDYTDLLTYNEKEYTVHNYYVKESLLDSIEIYGETNSGYGIVELGGTYDNYYKVYTIQPNDSSDTSYIVCLIKINVITDSSESNASFGNFVLDGVNYSGSNQKSLVQSTKSSIKLSWLAYNEVEGNKINVKVYFNNVYVRTISRTSTTVDNKLEYTMSNGGLYTFIASDLAGNVRTFAGVSSLQVYLINKVLFTVNNNTPINNYITNNSVTIKLITSINSKALYSNSVTVVATRNNASLTLTENGTNSYSFTLPGYYEVTLSAVVSGTSGTTVTNTYYFTIVKQDVATRSFEVSASYNFVVSSLIKNQANITSTLSTLDSLWLSVGEEIDANDIYTITLNYYNSELGTTQSFSFTVWISDSAPVINTLNKYVWGTSTSSTISFTFNGATIYNQVGSSYIVILLNDAVAQRINITSESVDTNISVSLSNSGTYKIRLYNDNDQLIVSYKAVKKVPLNTAAKIIIIIASILVVTLSVVFIVLRRSTKFR